MLNYVISVGGASLLLWPSSRPVSRLRNVCASNETDAASFAKRRWFLAPISGLVFAIIAGYLGGLAAVFAVSLLLFAGWRQYRHRIRTREEMSVARHLAQALRMLVGDLRAGAHPAVAAEATAEHAERHIARVLRMVAASERLGSRPELSASVVGLSDTATENVLNQFVRAWALAQRYGLPIAEVVDSVRRDVDAHLRFESHLRASMAGPRASATVLALLPCVGIALGEAMGADPMRVLATTTVGQVLLMIGSTLIFIGMEWTTWLTRSAVRK